MNTSVTVVISTYNRPHSLALVLQGLLAQSRPADAIHIADDGSVDDTRELLERHASRLPLRHFWHEDKGYRKTIIMNQALAAVETPYVIFLDGDCIPLKHFVSDHLELAAPRAILAGPRILASAGLTHQLEVLGSIEQLERRWFWMTQRLSGGVNRLAPLLRLPEGRWRDRSPNCWELVRGCNFSLQTNFAKAVGGFEESLYGWGPDDSDIAVRLMNHGLTIKNGRFAAPVLHLWHREEDRGNLERNRCFLESALREKRTQAVVSQLN